MPFPTPHPLPGWRRKEEGKWREEGRLGNFLCLPHVTQQRQLSHSKDDITWQHYWPSDSNKKKSISITWQLTMTSKCAWRLSLNLSLSPANWDCTCTTAGQAKAGREGGQCAERWRDHGCVRVGGGSYGSPRQVCRPGRPWRKNNRKNCQSDLSLKGQRRHQTSEVGAGCLTHNTLGLNPSLGPAEAGGLTLGGERIRRDLEDLQTQAEGLCGRGVGWRWGMASPGTEQSQRRRTSPPVLAQGPNQKGDNCFMAVLMHWADTKLGRLSAEPLLKRAPHTSLDKVRWLRAQMASVRCQELSSQKEALAAMCAAFPLELQPVVHFACPDYAGWFPTEPARKGTTFFLVAKRWYCNL